MKWLLLIVLFLWTPQIAKAVDFSVSNANVTDNEITVTATLSGLISTSCNEGKCYLQGTLRQPTTNYFGQTQNSIGSWVDYLSSPEPEYIISTFFGFQPDAGGWTGLVKMRFSPTESDYKGPGSYELKLRRFSGKSSSSSQDSNTLSVTLNVPLPTATSTPLPAPTNTPSPSNTPTPVPLATPTTTPRPSATPRISPTPRTSPTQAIVPSIGEQEYVQANLNSGGSKLLNLNEQSDDLTTPTPLVLGESTTQNTSNLGPILLIGGGVVGLAISLLLLFRRARSEDILT